MNIPDYKKAFLERVRDLRGLKQRRIMTMHVGCIAVECLISSLVANYYGVSAQKDKNTWVVTKNMQNGKNEIRINGHFLGTMVREIDELKQSLDGARDIAWHIQKLQAPLRGIPYIMLRYHGENEVTQSEFQEWHNAFKAVVKWLKKQEKDLSRGGKL